MECPESLVYLWNIFNNLDHTRTIGGMAGYNPLQFSEIKAYFELIQVMPFEWELTTLLKLDRIALKAHSENQASKMQGKPKVKSK